MLCKRAEELRAVPSRKGARRGEGRAAEEMNGAVAQLFRSMLCAILGDELDIDAFSPEAAELHGGRRYEIRGGVDVCDHQSKHERILCGASFRYRRFYPSGRGSFTARRARKSGMSRPTSALHRAAKNAYIL